MGSTYFRASEKQQNKQIHKKSLHTSGWDAKSRIAPSPPRSDFPDNCLTETSKWREVHCTNDESKCEVSCRRTEQLREQLKFQGDRQFWEWRIKIHLTVWALTAGNTHRKIRIGSKRDKLENINYVFCAHYNCANIFCGMQHLQILLFFFISYELFFIIVPYCAVSSICCKYNNRGNCRL